MEARYKAILLQFNFPGSLGQALGLNAEDAESRSAAEWGCHERTRKPD